MDRSVTRTAACGVGAAALEGGIARVGNEFPDGFGDTGGNRNSLDSWRALKKRRGVIPPGLAPCIRTGK